MEMKRNSQRIFRLVLCCVMLAGLLFAWPACGLAVPVPEGQLNDPGVYGWQIVRKADGSFVGGVRYPGDAGGGPAMTLTDAHFPNIPQATGWNEYVTATVHLGDADVTLTTDAGRSAFVETIKRDYELQIFLVDTHGAWDGTEYPYAWASREITDAEYSVGANNANVFTLKFAGWDTMHWDWTGNGPGPATFAVTAGEPDRMPDPAKAGVYGWRIVDKSGAIVGGVGYPGNAGGGPVMTLGNEYFAGITRANWGQYENATVDVGSTVISFSGDEDIAAFANTLKENYTLEIFFVETDGEYRGGKYPCAWMPWEIEAVNHTDENGLTHMFTLTAKNAQGLHWDYSNLNGGQQYPATFAVTATEPERITSNLATAWGLIDDTGFSRILNYLDYEYDLPALGTAVLTWPYDYKVELNGSAITASVMAPFMDDLRENYQLQVTYRDYGAGYGENNPATVAIPIRSVAIDSVGDGYAILKITPAIAHTFRWHWATTFYDGPGAELNYRIRVNLIKPVSDATAKAHIVSDRVVNPPSTTVNFFDYWLEDNGRWENDFERYQTGTENEVIKKGINNGHLLVFMGSFAFPGAQGSDNVSNLGRWNVWTGDELYAPYPDGGNVDGGYGNSSVNNFYANNDPDGILKPHRGIVAQKLVNGYPALALGGAAWLTSDDFSGARDYSNIYPDLMGGQFRNYFADVLVKDAGNAKGGESLAYLFDPKDVPADYKAVVSDVRGLFQMDDEGYYYFNSRENFAELVENGGTDENGKTVNVVNLYDEPWDVSASVDVNNATTDAKGQFFPFNKWGALFHDIGGGKVEQDYYNFRDQNRSAKLAGERPINHYFGMTVETEFQQPIGGTITQGRAGGNDIPMEFYFSGDDDAWIFIDDVLVGDIGGIHNPVSINISFATGEITYAALDAPGAPTDGSGVPYYTTSLREMFDAADKTRANSVNWVEIDNNGKKGYIFPNGSIHTLKFYYMERGNDVSDCSIRFNTLPVNKDSIRKVDDDGEILEGALFDLYEADRNGQFNQSAAWHTASEFSKTNAGAPIAKGLHIDNDRENPNLYTVLDENNKAIDFTLFVSNLKQTAYFILDEVQVPAGFRANPGIVLEFHPETYTFTVVNKYETGAYASFSAEWKQILKVHEATFNESTGALTKGDEVATAADPDPMKEGLTVVVPLIKSGGKWLPMFGSNTKGWDTVERGNNTLKTDLAVAALLQIADEDYQNWYMNWINTGGNVGNLVGSMANLPGDATRYVINDTKGRGDADLNLVALFLPKDTLQKLGVNIEANATDDERYDKLHELLAGVTGVDAARSFLKDKNAGESSFTLLFSNDFARSYRTVIYVPNERRELRVRKVDEQGEYINGAVFALFDTAANAAAYKAGANNLDGVMTELAIARNQGKGGLLAFGATASVNATGGQQDGMLIFREDAPGAATAANGYARIDWPGERVVGPGYSDKEDTVYWLKEIYVPDGYILSENLVRVEVGNAAVYANATGYDAKGNILTGDAAKDDGVTVRAELGKLAQTLIKYAIGNRVDVTLRDITIGKQTNQQPDRLPADGSGWSDAQPAESFDMHYGVGANVLAGQYGPHDSGAEPVFTATDGYIRVMPRQNQKQYSDAAHGAAKRDDLTGVDLDGLFSLINEVVVENRKLSGSLSVSKQVTGEELESGDTEREFAFTASFTDKDGKPLSGTYPYFSGEDKREGSFALAGVAGETFAFTLKHGQTVTIYNLPDGAQFAVAEGEYAQYNVTVTDAEGKPSQGKGVIATQGSAELVFVNEKIVVETGSLTVTKTVEIGDKKKDFMFSVSLSDKSISGTYGNMVFKDGESIFALHDGERKTATGLPAGIEYVVAETSANEDGYRLVSSTGAKGTISAQGSTAAFVNASVPMTGDGSHLELWLMLMCVSAISIIAAVARMRMKASE